MTINASYKILITPNSCRGFMLTGQQILDYYFTFVCFHIDRDVTEMPKPLTPATKRIHSCEFTRIIEFEYIV